MPDDGSHLTDAAVAGPLVYEPATASRVSIARGNGLTDREVESEIEKREHDLGRALGALARFSFRAQSNRHRSEQGVQLVRDLLAAETEVFRYRLMLRVTEAKRGAYLAHVQGEQWVSEAITRHQIAMSDKLYELFYVTEEARDYGDHKVIEALRKRIAAGVLSEAEGQAKIERTRELGNKRNAETLETIQRLLTEHRRFLSGVHDRLAADFRK